MKISFEWLQEYLPNINCHIFEIEDLLNNLGIDTEIITINSRDVLDIKPTPNKTYCSYLYGICREIALLSTSYSLSQLTYLPDEQKTNNKTLQITIDIQEGDFKCLKYGYIYIQNLNRAKTPQYILDRLYLNGCFSVDFISDIQRYVKLCFGYNILIVPLKENKRTINIENINFHIKDNFQYTNKQNNILGSNLCNDSYSSTPYLILVSCLESNHINKQTENMGYTLKDDYTIFEHVLYFLDNLLKDLGIPINIIQLVPLQNPYNRIIKFSTHAIHDLIGVDIKPHEIEELISYISYDLVNYQLIAYIPQYRSDLLIVEDVIEDILRIKGYKNIPSLIPHTSFSYITKKEPAIRNIKKIMKVLGYSEVRNLPFTTKISQIKFTNIKENNLIKIQNPLSQEANYLRTSVIPSLLENWQFNINRQISSMRLFEYGTVFQNQKEQKKLGALCYGISQDEHWRDKSLIDFYLLKGDLEYICGKKFDHKKTQKFNFLDPNWQIEIYYKGQDVGFLGMLHEDLISDMSIGYCAHKPWLFELNSNILIDIKPMLYRPFSKMPIVKRDISFIVSQGTEYSSILQYIETIALEESIIDINVLDVFALDDAKKSITIRVRFQEEDRTLNDQDIMHKLDKIISLIEQKLHIIQER